MDIVYSPNFVREYKRLGPRIKILAENREAIFKKNPFDAKIKTHKLHGRFGEFWAFSIDFRYRIIFKFIENNRAYFMDIGKHNIYE